MEGIEAAIFRFLKRSFSEGRCLCGFRQDPEVFPVVKAAYAVGGEAHRILGLLRFTKLGKLYVSDIRPTYDLTADHRTAFCRSVPFSAISHSGPPLYAGFGLQRQTSFNWKIRIVS